MRLNIPRVGEVMFKVSSPEILILAQIKSHVSWALPYNYWRYLFKLRNLFLYQTAWMYHYIPEPDSDFRKIISWHVMGPGPPFLPRFSLIRILPMLWDIQNHMNRVEYSSLSPYSLSSSKPAKSFKLPGTTLETKVTQYPATIGPQPQKRSGRMETSNNEQIGASPNPRRAPKSRNGCLRCKAKRVSPLHIMSQKWGLTFSVEMWREEARVLSM